MRSHAYLAYGAYRFQCVSCLSSVSSINTLMCIFWFCIQNISFQKWSFCPWSFIVLNLYWSICPWSRFGVNCFLVQRWWPITICVVFWPFIVDRGQSLFTYRSFAWSFCSWSRIMVNLCSPIAICVVLWPSRSLAQQGKTALRQLNFGQPRWYRQHHRLRVLLHSLFITFNILLES